MNLIGNRRTELAERLQYSLTLSYFTAPAHRAKDHRLIKHDDAHLNRKIIGSRFHEIPVEAHKRAKVTTKRDRTAQDIFYGMEPVLQICNNSEIPSASAQRPEKFCIF